MTPRLPILATLLTFGLAALSGAQTFTRGNIAAVLLDGGGASLTSTGVEAQIVEFARAPGAGGATSTPLNAVKTGVFLAGSGTSEGQIMADGGNPENLYFGGYTSGGASVAATSGATNPRRAARFNWESGALATTALGANDFSSGSIRSVVSVGGSLFAAGSASAGNDSGVLSGPSAPFGGTQDLTPVVDNFVIPVAQNLGGTIYFSSQTANKIGVYALSGGSAVPVLSLTSSSQIFDFLFTDADTLYYADATATTGGIYRSARGTDGKFGAPAKLPGSLPGRSLAFDGTTLYANTTEATNNRIVSFAPDGSNLATVAFAGNGRVIRGIEVVPEPASLAALGLGIAALARRRKARG